MIEANDNDWIEKELARQFAPVKAPDCLWNRVQSARRGARPTAQAGWILWPAVALLFFVASGDLLWELGSARSNEPARMDVKLSYGQPGNARATGGRLIKRSRADYSIAFSPSKQPAMKENPAACNLCHLDARTQL